MAFPLVLAMTALASFCFVKTFEGTLPENASAVDVLIWAFDPSAGISLPWFVCRACLSLSGVLCVPSRFRTHRGVPTISKKLEKTL